VVSGARGTAPVLAFGLGAFAAGAAVRQVVLATRRNGWRGLVGRTNGGMIVHLGVVIIAVALAASQSYSSEVELRLHEGEVARVQRHTLVYEGLETREDPEKTTIAARVRVNGNRVFRPAVNEYVFGGQIIGTPSVSTGLREDVFLALLDVPEEPGDPAVVRVVLQPLVTWLWIGGGVMAFGTLLAAFPGKRRRPTEPTSDPGGQAEPDPSPELVGTGS
jgi:cytochrome c-type biogenesis protein CcmF